MAEAAAGLGLMMGPVIGSFIYASLQYMYTFFVFSGIMLLNCILVSIILPNSLNQPYSSEVYNNNNKNNNASIHNNNNNVTNEQTTAIIDTT
jgi:hypothetical protein